MPTRIYKEPNLLICKHFDLIIPVLLTARVKNQPYNVWQVKVYIIRPILYFNSDPINSKPDNYLISTK